MYLKSTSVENGTRPRTWINFLNVIYVSGSNFINYHLISPFNPINKIIKPLLAEKSIYLRLKFIEGEPQLSLFNVSIDSNCSTSRKFMMPSFATSCNRHRWVGMGKREAHWAKIGLIFRTKKIDFWEYFLLSSQTPIRIPISIP